MRALILGGAGMLGHKVWQVLDARLETWVTLRSASEPIRRLGLIDERRTLAGVDATDLDSVVDAFARARPHVVVNCVGVIKQLPQASDPVVALRLNALFPHQLARLCGAAGSRLIHVSTDCVFSGRDGHYTEDSRPDAEDLYGRTKLLGEVTGAGALTLRTSIIGRELASRNGLVEWFLSNRGGRVRGYARAVFSGLPTIVLAELIADLVTSGEPASGLFHVSAAPVNKFELLRLVNEAYRADITIVRDDDVVIDRSLDSTRFRERTAFDPPAWPALVDRMASDATPYRGGRE